MKWMKRIFSRRRLYDDLSEEIQEHLEEKVEEMVAGGMSKSAAIHAARREFGNAGLIERDSREVWQWPSFETVLMDVRYGMRILAKNPNFACAVILVLALGIGATVAIFAFVDAALIKPLPYQNPNRLVGVYERIEMIPRSNLSYPDYLDWKKMNSVFSSLEVWDGTGYLMSTPGGMQPVPGVRVSAGFFRTLGVTPALGRDFYDGEDLPGAPRTVMLSHTAWQNWFGARPDVIGETVTLSGIPHTIIGVLPREFHFAPRGRGEFWTTLQATSGCDVKRGCHNLYGIARLKDGISAEAASANMTAIAAELEREYPDSNRGQGAAVISLSEAISGDVRPVLLTLLGGAALLLLIACVNAASLLLVRSEGRKREIVVRGALGASPARLVRQFVTEGLVLAAAGSALGLIAAGWAMQFLVKLIPKDMLPGMPYLEGLGLNVRVMAFAGAISLLAAVLLAITPIVRLRLSNLRDGLNEGGRGSAGTLWRRLGANLVVVELAIAVVLLGGAGLLGKSFYRLLHVETGLQPDHVATLEVAAPMTSYGKDEQAVALGRQVVSRIGSLPGVKSVGISSQLPLTGNGSTTWIRFLGRPYHGEHNEVNFREVSADYFATLEAKLLRGRCFTDAEDASKPPVVIINQTLARQYFPDEDPIGAKIGDTDLSPLSTKEIIGVVHDIREGSLDSEIWPAMYYPFNQSPDADFALVVRTSQAEQSVLPTIVAAIHQIDPSIGTIGESTMSERINDSPAAYIHRSAAWLAGGFAVLALLLGAVGFYGVVSYSVSQRTREIGIRIALGAQTKSVYQLILREAAWLAGIGTALGLAGAAAAATMIRGLLFGVDSWDAPNLASVATVLLLTAIVASYVPARRATRVDPITALRNE